VSCVLYEYLNFRCVEKISLVQKYSQKILLWNVLEFYETVLGENVTDDIQLSMNYTFRYLEAVTVRCANKLQETLLFELLFN